MERDEFMAYLHDYEKRHGEPFMGRTDGEPVQYKWCGTDALGTIYPGGRILGLPGMTHISDPDVTDVRLGKDIGGLAPGTIVDVGGSGARRALTAEDVQRLEGPIILAAESRPREKKGET